MSGTAGIQIRRKYSDLYLYWHGYGKNLCRECCIRGTDKRIFCAVCCCIYAGGGVMHVLYYYTYAGYIIRQVIVRDRELMVFLGVSFGFLLLLYRQLVRNLKCIPTNCVVYVVF